MLLSKLTDKIFKVKIKCSVVVVAAGSSQRFGEDKLFTPLMGIPVLAYSLMTLESSALVSEIIVVTAQQSIVPVAELCDKYAISKVTKVVCGGASRLESALSGVSETDPHCSLIAIHDGARPLMTKELLENVINCAQKNKAAIPAVPAKETVKITAGGLITSTPDRAAAFNAQTPQVFLPELIKGALTNALEKNLIIYDDASAVEDLGYPVYITNGSAENLKITSPLDLSMAELILKSRKLNGGKPAEAGGEKKQ